jgi:hypothetical protein
MKRVSFAERRAPGKAIIYVVGVAEPGKPGLKMVREFYRKDSKPRADDYAAWLGRLIVLEEQAAAKQKQR